MDILSSWLAYGDTLTILTAIGSALLILIIWYGVLFLLPRLLRRVRLSFMPTTEHLIELVPRSFGLVLALHAFLTLYPPLPEVASLLQTALFLCGLLLASRSIYGLLNLMAEGYIRQRIAVDRQETLRQVGSMILAFTVGAVTILMALSSLGIQITTLVASLGIGGIAIAFALQHILSDIFSSFSLYLDQPFRIGDYIVFDTFSGTVRKIGLRSTRIQLLQGEELIVPNTLLTAKLVRNFKRMERRRVECTLSIAHGAPLPTLRKLPAKIRTLIEGMQGTRFDRAHLTGLSATAYTYEVVYSIDTGDHVTYCDRQQELYLALLELYEKEGLKTA